MNDQFQRAGHFDETSVFNVPLIREFVEVIVGKPLLVESHSFTLSLTHLGKTLVLFVRNSE
jgi:hypothetical protein